MSDMTYIIGHRGSTGHRFENLKSTIKAFKCSNVDVLVVEQDTKPFSESMVKSLGASYIFAFNDKMYNRSWGFNVGYKQTTSDIIGVGDNDLIMSQVDVQRVIEDFKSRKLGTCSPYGTVIDCALPQTMALRQVGFKKTKGTIRRGCNYAGGILFFKRGVFEIIGGWDERFEGWGGEDDHLFSKLKKTQISMCTYANNCLHLFHERGKAARAFHENYKNNLSYISHLNSMTNEQCKEWCSGQFDDIGNIEKYV